LPEDRCWSEPEQVILPSSGVTLSLCRPTPAYFRLRRLQWSAELLEKCDFQTRTGERADFTPEERLFIVKELQGIIEQSIIQARLSSHPAPGPVEFVWVRRGDDEFIVNYLLGDLAAGLGNLMEETPEDVPAHSSEMVN
jgi:hypothetical protein